MSDNGSAAATSGGVQSSSGNFSYNAPGDIETTETTLTASSSSSSSSSAVAKSHPAYAAASASAMASSSAGAQSVTTTVSQMQNNTASIDGSALRGASGNIGANVASGNNNLQRNSLAVAAGRDNNTM